MKQIPPQDTRFITKEGIVTPRLRRDLSDVLLAYSDTAKFWADKKPSERQNYTVREVYIVGSTLRGVDYSDLDLLIIPDKIDYEDGRFFKMVLAQIFFTNRAKSIALDLFVRPHDQYPEKPSFEITPQVRDIIDKYNQHLLDD